MNSLPASDAVVHPTSVVAPHGASPEDQSPERCSLCNRLGYIEAVAFKQLYAQADRDPVRLDWWACRACHGWFAHPMPSLEAIGRHWQTVDWAWEDRHEIIGRRKRYLFDRVLGEVAKRAQGGRLLDIGSNFGALLVRARDAGWQASGYEPNEEAAAYSRRLGFDVRSGWDLTACGFTEGKFQAVTVIDVFCCSLSPFGDLQTYQRLLAPGGVMAMRLTNKHAALRLLNRSMPPGDARDRIISRMLLGQFHSAAPQTMTQLLREQGLEHVEIIGGIPAVAPHDLRWKSRLAYAAAEAVRIGSFGHLNISPGILLLAQKAR